MRDLADRVTMILALSPQNDSGGADVNGATINMATYDYAEECKFNVMVGTSTGSPTSYTVASRVQDSADGSTWADITGVTGTTLTADDTSTEIWVDRKKYRQYIRVVILTTFVGGTTPAIDICAGCAIAEKKYN